VQDLFEKECQMALQDKVQEETSERKNKLEAYIYSLRNKLSESLVEYVTDAEREDVSQRLEAAEVSPASRKRVRKGLRGPHCPQLLHGLLVLSTYHFCNPGFPSPSLYSGTCWTTCTVLGTKGRLTAQFQHLFFPRNP
jgi:hypothetical protein